jgi:isopenicillin N synthase-like dioxygenase
MGSIKEPQAASANLPIIDFANWASDGTAEQRYEIGKKLAEACHNVGFVYIINHGVSPVLLEEAFGWSKRLFDLKHEEKMLAPHPDGPTVHRGYSYPGLEKVSQVISSDLEVGEKLREVRDCKVCLQRCLTGLRPIWDRKVMRSEATTMTSNQTSGCLKKCFPDTENS